MDHPQFAVRILDDLDAFASCAAPRLAADPVATNVIGSLLASARSGARFPGAAWIVVEDPTGTVVSLAVNTPPMGAYLIPAPDGAADAVARALHAAGRDLSGVNGDVRATEDFARTWSALTGAKAWRCRDVGVHVLGELVPPSGVPGAVRVAADGDVDLLVAWNGAFQAEVHPEEPHAVDRERLALRVAGGAMLLWEVDGVPVSYAGWHPPAGGFARIGPVYTPPGHRRHGYAAAVTAAASRTALAAGAERLMLFTDLANPTSNGVYARLGFRRAGDSSEWLFTDPRRGATSAT